jgi:hypothetical protein
VQLSLIATIANDPLCSNSVSQSYAAAPQQAGFVSDFRPGGTIWLGGRDRTSEWRNQNQFGYSTISKSIWKRELERPPTISTAWQRFSK